MNGVVARDYLGHVIGLRHWRRSVTNWCSGENECSVAGNLDFFAYLYQPEPAEQWHTEHITASPYTKRFSHKNELQTR